MLLVQHHDEDTAEREREKMEKVAEKDEVMRAGRKIKSFKVY